MANLKLKATEIRKLQVIKMLDSRGRKYRRNIDYGSGRHCEYIRLSPKVGVKIYRGILECVMSHYCQHKANRSGIGPKAGDLFILDHKCSMYCYLTEVIRVCAPNVSNYLVRKAVQAQVKIGLTGWDSCSFNLGHHKGKIVFLDFGCAWEASNIKLLESQARLKIYDEGFLGWYTESWQDVA